MTSFYGQMNVVTIMLLHYEHFRLNPLIQFQNCHVKSQTLNPEKNTSVHKKFCHKKIVLIICLTVKIEVHAVTVGFRLARVFVFSNIT